MGDMACIQCMNGLSSAKGDSNVLDSKERSPFLFALYYNLSYHWPSTRNGQSLLGGRYAFRRTLSLVLRFCCCSLFSLCWDQALGSKARFDRVFLALSAYSDHSWSPRAPRLQKMARWDSFGQLDAKASEYWRSEGAHSVTTQEGSQYISSYAIPLPTPMWRDSRQPYSFAGRPSLRACAPLAPPLWRVRWASTGVVAPRGPLPHHHL